MANGGYFNQAEIEVEVVTTDIELEVVGTGPPGPPGPKQVYADTTANWNSQVYLIGEAENIYVYTDYQVIEGHNIPALKVGDGSSYLIDLPFISGSSPTSAIHIDTTANWNDQPTLLSSIGHIYVYSDYMIIGGTNIPGIKIGDGQTYLIDMPFVSGNEDLLNAHINNTDVHITQAERAFWNNKNRAYINENDQETLILTTL